VVAFASARDALGADEVVVDAEGWTARRVVSALCEGRPALASLGPSLGFAVNGEWVTPDAVLRGGDELALLPPVSGG
jgi:molybdopterin converting factor small subunit